MSDYAAALPGHKFKITIPEATVISVDKNSRNETMCLVATFNGGDAELVIPAYAAASLTIERIKPPPPAPGEIWQWPNGRHYYITHTGQAMRAVSPEGGTVLIENMVWDKAIRIFKPTTGEIICPKRRKVLHTHGSQAWVETVPGSGWFHIPTERNGPDDHQDTCVDAYCASTQDEVEDECGLTGEPTYICGCGGGCV